MPNGIIITFDLPALRSPLPSQSTPLASSQERLAIQMARDTASCGCRKPTPTRDAHLNQATHSAAAEYVAPFGPGSGENMPPELERPY
jgi:hypothetical protein